MIGEVNSDLTRRAATLTLMLVTVAAGSPSFTHAHSAADRHAVAGDEGHVAEGRRHDHAQHGGDEGHGHGVPHRHVAVLGLLDVEVPVTPDRPMAERGDEPFVLLEEVPVPNADDASANALNYAAAVRCPRAAEPATANRGGRTPRPPLVGSVPRSAVLRV